MRQPTVTRKHITSRNTEMTAWTFPNWKLGFCFSLGKMFFVSTRNKMPVRRVGTPYPTRMKNGHSLRAKHRLLEFRNSRVIARNAVQSLELYCPMVKKPNWRYIFQATSCPTFDHKMTPTLEISCEISKQHVIRCGSRLNFFVTVNKRSTKIAAQIARMLMSNAKLSSSFR